MILFSNEHGVDIPIRQCASPLRLRSRDPRIVAVLFQSAQAAEPGNLAPRVRFTTRLAGTPKENIGYKITLAKDTAGVTRAYWTYGNIARFVADALERGLDTVTIKSTTDAPSEEVWLPGCDDPVRISLTHSVLDVTIYKASRPNQAADRMPGSSAPGESGGP